MDKGDQGSVVEAIPFALFGRVVYQNRKMTNEFEVRPRVFTATLIPLLASAMHLRSQPITEEDYYRQAAALQQTIVSVSQQPAQHLGIRHIQDIFRDHADRLYHWVDNRNVPADNNRSERELRPTVIARKVSFGSQSEAGAKTREIMMSLLHTLKKRHQHPEDYFKSVLDRLASDIKQDTVSLLFPADSS